MAPLCIGEQRSFTNGRIVVACVKARRVEQKRADYMLYCHRDYPLAVVEAKEIGLHATLERVFVQLTRKKNGCRK